MDRDALIAKTGQRPEDLLHQIGRKPDRRFINQDELGIEQQRAGDFELLLLTAGKFDRLLAAAFA